MPTLKLSLVALALCLGGNAWAGSTVNPTVPAANAPLASAPVRNNFAATYTDINNILGKFAGTTAPSSPTNLQDWVNTSGGSTYTFNFWNVTTNSWVQWGSLNVSTGVFTSTAALSPINAGYLVANCTGSSAAPVGCSWNSYANQAIGNTNGMLPYRTGGSWSTISTGTSGTTIPLNNTANVYSAAQTINLTGGAIQSPQSGSLLQMAQVTGTIARAELDAYANTPRWSCVRADGTSTSLTALQANDEACSLNMFGHNGVAFVGPTAAVRMYASANWTASPISYGTYIDLATVAAADTTGTLTSRMRVENDGGITVGGATSQGSGTLNLLGNLYNNGTAPTGTGAYVRATSPSLTSATIAGLTVTGSLTATGLEPLTNIASQSANTIVGSATAGSPTALPIGSCSGAANAVQWVLNTGFQCGVITAAASSIAVGTTSITGGSIGNIFYHAASNLLGELTTTGSGTVVALAASPTFTGTVAMAASTYSGTANFSGAFQISGTAQTFRLAAAGGNYRYSNAVQ